MPLMSRPNTNTLPESGRTSPSAVFSNTVLPLPAAPKITRDSPSRASKLRSRRASAPSNETQTCSNRRIGGLLAAGSIYAAWLTKILVTTRSRMKINTVDITMACVVARPTPCVPPLVRNP